MSERPASARETLSGHVIVCGLGHVGYRSLCLLRQLGRPAVVITREASDPFREAIEPHFRIVLGDARDERLLQQVGIEGACGVLAVTNDDMANVSIALDARRMNAEAHIVVRLFDQELAAHLEKSIKINRALSASALAVPAFTAAALAGSVRDSFQARGACCTVEDRVVTAGSSAAGRTVGQWAADTGEAVMALQRGGELTAHPAATTAVLPGDRLTVLHLHQETDAHGSGADCQSARGGLTNHPARRRRQRTKPGLSTTRALLVGLREWWHDVPRALRTAFFALLAVVALSVVVFHYALDLPFVDALYFVITTVTTVGYGDYNLQTASPAMKLYGSFLMLCGAAIVAALFSMVTDLILWTRLRDVIARSSPHFKGHIVVAGLGNIGFRLVRELVESGETVVAIERRPDVDFIGAAREVATVLVGNARTEETLRRAGVAGAKAVVAATDDDLANLSIALAAKRANPGCRVVLRIFDSTLAEKMQHGLAIDAVVSMSATAAPTFVGAALCPEMLQGILLPGYLVLVFHHMIQGGGAEPKSRVGQPAEHEAILFVKPVGTATYQPADPGRAAAAGGEVLGARWYRLGTAPCA